MDWIKIEENSILLKYILGVCVACSPNCKICNPSDTCVVCNQGYYLFNQNLDGKLVCTKCDGPKQYKGPTESWEGTGLFIFALINFLIFFFSKGICLYCDLANCNLCQADKAFCQECASSYSLKDSNSDKKFEECSTCSSISGWSNETTNGVGWELKIIKIKKEISWNASFKYY